MLSKRTFAASDTPIGAEFEHSRKAHQPALLCAKGLRELAGAVASPKRETTVETDEGLAVGRAAFRPFEPREVMSLHELAQWLEVEPETVKQLAESGDLPGRRLGEEWRFARAAVLNWLAAR